VALPRSVLRVGALDDPIWSARSRPVGASASESAAVFKGDFGGSVRVLTAIAILGYALADHSDPTVPLHTYIVGPVGHQLQVAARPAQQVPHPTVRGPVPNGFVPGATTYSYSLSIAASGEVKVSVSVSPSAISGPRSTATSTTLRSDSRPGVGCPQIQASGDAVLLLDRAPVTSEGFKS
jgi:hypothetical protein